MIEQLTEPEDTVLDPFLGGGTTLLACRVAGRHGIGFEIDGSHESNIRKQILADTPSLFMFNEGVPA